MTAGDDRRRLLERVRERDRPWDVLVIGGGATGTGAAVEAASRGYDTLLLERDDFGAGTSSRSTKLAHGGVRYLRQGRLGLVFEALRERSRMLRNAPHLVGSRSFLLPAYQWWERPWYGMGLKLYDLLSGPRNLDRSRLLSRPSSLRRMPNLARRDLRGGVLYQDGQFDDARLVVTLARTVAAAGGVTLNYAPVRGLITASASRTAAGRVRGVVAEDRESGRRLRIPARAVINAAGPYADAVRRLERPNADPVVRPSRGTHLVVGPEVLGGETALIVPETRDERVLFAIPWHGRVLVGTTDVPVERAPDEPRPSRGEIRYLLDHLNRYLAAPPGLADVRSAFAGIRPLVAADAGTDTAELSREHRIFVSDGGLVTVVGGKWTTYREMGEDAVDRAARVAGLPERESRTRELPLHGADGPAAEGTPWGVYGSDAARVRRLAEEEGPATGARLDPRLPFRDVQATWAARHEMARTVEDVLARRTPCLFLDARAAHDAAPRTARILARELGRGEGWVREQTRTFQALARSYLPPGGSRPGPEGTT